MATDLFSTRSLDSLVRGAFKPGEPIDLSKVQIDAFSLNPGYNVSTFHFPSENYAADIRRAIEPLCEEAEKQGYGSSLFTALYEAVLNAHQHGNRKDPQKTITIAHRFTHDEVTVAIADEGGELDPEFVPFVIDHREGRHKKGFIDYYTFTAREKPKGNNGTGTSFMHTYVDDVKYFKSASGGLVVLLQKNK
jgi:anti-sigma regulatory factor (Ser/Thr protein kinase)